VAVLRNLSHANIVQYLGTQRDDEVLNIFLEYVPGGSIALLLQKFGCFSERVVRTYTRQLLQVRVCACVRVREYGCGRVCACVRVRVRVRT
jgi:serine/threonine protein kinase